MCFSKEDDFFVCFVCSFLAADAWPCAPRPVTHSLIRGFFSSAVKLRLQFFLFSFLFSGDAPLTFFVVVVSQISGAVLAPASELNHCQFLRWFFKPWRPLVPAVVSDRLTQDWSILGLFSLEVNKQQCKTKPHCR